MAKPSTRRPADLIGTDPDDLLAGAIRLGRHLVLTNGRRLPIISGADGEAEGDEGGDDEGGASTERLAEITAALANEDEAPTLEQLQTFEGELVTLFRARQAESTDEALEEARQIADVLRDVRARVGEAEAERERTAEAFAELVAELDLDGEGDGDGENEGDGDEAGEGEGDETTDEAGELVGNVTASGAPAAQQVATAPLPARTAQPAAVRPLQVPRVQVRARVSLLASGASTGRGGTITPGDYWDAAVEANRGLGRVPASAGEVRIPVMRVEYDLPDTVDLRGASADEAGELMDRYLGFEALQAQHAAQQRIAQGDRRAVTAAICAPLDVDFDLPVIGNGARPIRDSLPTFQADRGGVRWVPSPTLADVPADFSGVWTPADDDEDPFVNKVCAVLTCASETSAELEAEYRCLTLKNFMYRYSRTRVDAFTSIIDTAFARWSEERILAKFAAGSTAVTSAVNLGATRDVLNQLDIAVARFRRRHRIPAGVPMDFYYPDWLHTMIRVDIAKALPGGAIESNLLVAEAEIQAFIRSRNVTPIPFLDGENATQRMAEAQTAGALLGLPTTAVMYLFPRGTWVRFDGGTMDLGVTRDSTLNVRNELQMFEEEFGNTVKRGSLQSLRWTATLCPNGAVAGTVAPAACA